MASRIATELIFRNLIHTSVIRCDINGPTLILRGHMSVVLNTSVSSSALKKKHNAIAYHRL